MRLFLCAAAAAALVVPAPAKACLSAMMPEAVLFDVPPAHRPPGYALLRVVGRAGDHDDGLLFVTIVDPAQARRLGPAAWLGAAPMSSCTTWGRLGSEAYVVARVAGRLRGRLLLAAMVYRRSRWDRLWDLFGWEAYRAAGQPLKRDESVPTP